MGNIVNNTVVVNQPQPPHSDQITIEGVDTEQSTVFSTEPFGPIPTPLEILSDAELPLAPLTPPITPPKSLTGAAQSATELLINMPDVQQMMKDLEKSGCLLPELQIRSTRRIDSSPLAALQPRQLQDQAYFSSPTDVQPMTILPEVQLASTHPVSRSTPQELPLFVFVAIFGLVQSLQGIAMVAHFIFVKYPEYELMIVASVLATSDADTAVVKAVIVCIMAVISLLFSSLLLIKRSKNRSVEIYVVISIVVINFLVQNILPQNVLASGNPLQLPEIVSEIISSTKQ